ncbi:MAG: protein translocase subunit SecDF [Bacteroidales bacterium]|nr:protein translocase subunit SecDF [Bacteroidales bacterium]
MQNKGAIRFFTIVLALVSIYQLLFTVFAQKVERDARKYAGGNVRLERTYLDSMRSEVVYNILVKKYTYQDCKEREINLGLDLKGGMNVILEIAVEDIIRSLAAPQFLTDPVFTETMRTAHQMKQTSTGDFVDLFAEAFETNNPGGQLAQFFMTPETRGDINFNTSNDEVVEFLKLEAEDAIDNSYNVLRNRIDKFGVVQLNIQKMERQGRILVELPGVKEPERVTKLLTGTANLEFWTTYQNVDIWSNIEQANSMLAGITKAEDLLGPEETVTGESETGIGEDALIEELQEEERFLDTEQEELLLDTAGLDLLSDIDTAADYSAEEMQFMKENPLFALLRPYVDNSGNLIPTCVVGVAELKDTATINEYLSIPQIRQLFPSDLRFVWHFQTMSPENPYILLHALKATRNGQPVLSGSYITDARADADPYGSGFEVNMSMNSEGAKKWANITRENVGKPIAVVLDEVVYSYPSVREEIRGGSSSISGNFTQTEAEDLANILKSGKMPARARIESSEVIGPSLGAKSVRDGLNSFMIAFLVVLAYMVFYYSRRAGLVADIALIANMFFLIGVLASLQAVLTLPGIAGIILTIGMSVDANVLIYERIREELAAGKNKKLAIKDGYSNAYSAIFDANITTFLTGLILFFFGTGPIKGFATTLVIGILTSLFSAIILTRLIYERMLEKGSTLTFDTKLARNAFKNANFDFLGKRKIFYVISAVIIILGIGSLAIRGLNLGVDFSGGRNYVISFKEDVEVFQVRDDLTEAFGEQPIVITFGSKNTVRVTTKHMIDDDRPEVDSIIKAKMFAGLQDYIEDDVSLDEFINGQDYVISSHKVGPTIAVDIKRSAIIVIFASLLIIFLYILIRFRNWQFGLGATAALVHDVVIVIGLFSLLHGVMPFSLELDQSFIAAILTVVGYSINDTVVVFDRIREYVGLQRKRERKEIFNKALNATLGRTFSTSLSTFVVLLAIFIFGGDVIRGFIFALLIGVIVGTYSSLFIATPIVYDTIHGEKSTTALSGTRKK